MSQTPETDPPIDRRVRIAQLIDLYGPLLTEKQLTFVRMHYEEDLSFGEISKEYGVSRQAIHDAVKHAEASLDEYDQKLGLSPGAARRRPEGSPNSVPAEAAAPAHSTVAGLGPAIEALDELTNRVQRSGGVIYNADGLARDLGRILDNLKQISEE